MFGADTPLVMDALQVAALAALAAGGAMFFVLRRRPAAPPKPPVETRTKNDLEERVQVLERIATDRVHDLAGEIEALREEPAIVKSADTSRSALLEGQNQ